MSDLPFESYYLTWYDGSYGDGGPYGEPFLSNWLAEFLSYFAGGWGDDAVPGYINTSEKSDDLFAGEVIQHGSHNADDSQAVYISNQWLGQLDAEHKDDDYNIYHARQVSEAATADSWDEMGLVESIFGQWPLLKLDLEDQTEPAVA